MKYFFIVRKRLPAGFATLASRLIWHCKLRMYDMNINFALFLLSFLMNSSFLNCLFLNAFFLIYFLTSLRYKNVKMLTPPYDKIKTGNTIVIVL